MCSVSTGINYYVIAENEFEYLMKINNTVVDYYNPIAIQSQQIAEKYLKHLLDVYCTDTDNTDLLKSHKLHRIYDKISAKFTDLKLDKNDLRMLSEYYFDTRYPGVDFTFVTKEEAEKCIEVVIDVRNKVNSMIKILECK